MTEHLITPSDELIGEWIDTDEGGPNVISRIATRATQWGADQELEACGEWLMLNGYGSAISRLRAARRPKLLSLKQQALQALNDAVKMADDVPPEGICSGQAEIIRRALEQLPDNEKS